MIRNLKDKLAMMGGAAAPMSAVSQAQPVSAPVAAPCCGRYRRLVDLDGIFGGITPRLFLQATPQTLGLVCHTPLPKEYRPEDALFVDIESTGLFGAGVLAFLVGIGFFDGEGFIIEQYLMHEYDQEADMLDCISRRLAAGKALVTFNGKSFDAPMLNSRSVLNRILLPLDRLPHLDVLHAARRMYKRRLGGCSLTHLEEEVLGLTREGDIPGSEIPEVFFSYLETRDFTRMQQVIDHNQQDILSMMLVLSLLCQAYDCAETLSKPEDIFSLGVCQERNGHFSAAEECYRRAIEAELPEARWALAALCKRRGDPDAAAALWEQSAMRDERVYDCCVELAKYYEHNRKEPEEALKWSLTGLSWLRGMGGTADDPRVEAMVGRIARLRARL